MAFLLNIYCGLLGIKTKKLFNIIWNFGQNALFLFILVNFTNDEFIDFNEFPLLDFL
jgi:hypothetical protein